MKTSSPKQIRGIAYDKMMADWKTPCLLALIYIVVAGLLAEIPYIGVLISIFIGLPIAYAFTLAVRHILLGQGEASVQYMVDQVKNNYERAFLVPFLSGLFLILWFLLLVIPGFIKSYAYSMAIYVAEDEPELKPIECIRKSEKLMKGHKMDLFILDLTFIGWLLLGIITLGIGLIFVSPYMEMAHAEFYRELTATEEAPAEESVEEPVAEAEAAVEEAVEEVTEEVAEETSEEKPETPAE